MNLKNILVNIGTEIKKTKIEIYKACMIYENKEYSIKQFKRKRKLRKLRDLIKLKLS